MLAVEVVRSSGYILKVEQKGSTNGSDMWCNKKRDFKILVWETWNIKLPFTEVGKAVE